MLKLEIDQIKKSEQVFELGGIPIMSKSCSHVERSQRLVVEKLSRLV